MVAAAGPAAVANTAEPPARGDGAAAETPSELPEVAPESAALAKPAAELTEAAKLAERVELVRAASRPEATAELAEVARVGLAGAADQPEAAVEPARVAALAELLGLVAELAAEVAADPGPGWPRVIVSPRVRWRAVLVAVEMAMGMGVPGGRGPGGGGVPAV